MNRSLWKSVVGLLVATAATVAFAQAQGQRECLLGNRNSIFTPREWRDSSLEDMARAELGVFDPRFDHFYLFFAYRRIANKALTSQDLDALRAFDPCWDDGSRQPSSSLIMGEARKAWLEARRRPGLPPLRQPEPGTRTVMGYDEAQIPNCNPDAYRKAAHTLLARHANHDGTQWLRDWVEAQDRVLQFCHQANAPMPASAPAGAPAWLVADRAYQLAAAELYAGKYEQAARSFVAIAQDHASPWQPLGLYLAARARLRQASAAREEIQRDALIREARELLAAALSSPIDAGIRNDVARMMQRVRLRIEPEQVFAEIDERLGAPVLPPGVGQDLRDFDAARAAGAKFDARDPGFAAWLHALRTGSPPPAGDISSASPLAFVAWLVSAKPGDPGVRELLHRAEKIPAESPAYRTVQLHRIRLLEDRAEALRVARRMLALPRQALDTQDRNRFKAVAFPLAGNATELAVWAYREPIDHPAVPRLAGAMVPAVDEDGALVLNRALSLDRLYALYISAATPKAVRDELLGVVWSRALVLDRWDLLQKLQRNMLAAFPTGAGILNRMEAARGTPEQRQLASLFLVRHPGILGSVPAEIAYADPHDRRDLAMPNMHRRLLQDGSRDNWWCSLPAGRWWHQGPAPAPPALPTFLTTEERKRWRAEYDKLVAQPNGTEYLAPAVLEWAKAHPRDAELPQALRMIVRSARGGCITASAKWMGQAAFRHLHQYFPRSDAAKKTRSWG